jgi:hypothetical protein
MRTVSASWLVLLLGGREQRRPRGSSSNHCRPQSCCAVLGFAWRQSLSPSPEKEISKISRLSTTFSRRRAAATLHAAVTVRSAARLRALSWRAYSDLPPRSSAAVPTRFHLLVARDGDAPPPTPPHHRPPPCARLRSLLRSATVVVRGRPRPRGARDGSRGAGVATGSFFEERRLGMEAGSITLIVPP